MSGIEKEKPRFEASEDMLKCYKYLRGRDRATYEELSTHVKRDIRGRNRYILTSAQEKLEREGIVFVIVTGVGVQRADNAQVAQLSTSSPISKIKRVVKRSDKRQKIVNVQSLDIEQRAEFYVGRAVLGAIKQAAREAFLNQVAGAVNINDGPLSVEQTLQLFAKLKPNGNA